MRLAFDLHMHSCLSPCGGAENTPADLAAMCALAGDAALRERYGRAGYERVCTEFSEQHMMELLLEQMRQLAGEAEE